MAKKRRKPEKERSIGRGIWKGTITFGLVNIPVSLASAQQSERIHFKMIDKRDHAPVGYKHINKATGKEIKKQDIVKAFEYKKDKYVVMNDADFKKAQVKATNTIDIEDFVELEEVDFLLFERPYYIIPQRNGIKGYALLRDVLQRTQKAAIAKIVLHTVQHLAAVVARGDYLILELLRFADEVKEVEEVEYLDPEAVKAKPSPKEIKIAEQLVDGMTAKWEPQRYKNTYREDLMRIVNAKVRKGTTTEIEEVPKEDVAPPPENLIDMTSLLEKSLRTARRSKSKNRSTRHEMR